MEDTNQIAFKQVTNTFVNETSELEHIHVNGETITATPEHPFYVDKLGWRLADNLRAGDVLVLSNGEVVTVEWVQHEILEQPVKVYNFEVQDYHTYFVGQNSVLVHNTCNKDERIQAVYNKCGHDVGKIIEDLYNKDPNCAEKFLDIFEEQVNNNNESFFNNLKNSSDKEEAIKFLIDYGDDAVKTIEYYPQKISKYIKIINKNNNLTKPEEIVRALNRIKYDSKWINLINNISENDEYFKKNWALALNKISEDKVNELYNFLSKLNEKVPIEGESFKINRGLATKKIAQYGDLALDGMNNAKDELDKFVKDYQAKGIDIYCNYMACVAVDTQSGKLYMGLSGTTKAPNPTIDKGKVPNYVEQNKDYENYYKNILSADIKEAQGNTKIQLEKLSNALQKTRDAAKAQNYKGTFCEEHPVENCAEIWAARNAILDGANFDDLAFRAESTSENRFAYPCINCKHTFSGLIVLDLK